MNNQLGLKITRLGEDQHMYNTSSLFSGTYNIFHPIHRREKVPLVSFPSQFLIATEHAADELRLIGKVMTRNKSGPTTDHFVTPW